MIGRLLYVLVGFIEALVGLRFIFRLIGVNPGSPFVHWIYSWSTPFVSPFAGIFGQQATVTGQGAVVASVFDWTALIALLVYGIIGGLIARSFTRLAPR